MKTLKTALRSNSRTEPANTNGSLHHTNGSTQFLSDPVFANGYHDLLAKRENGSNLPSDSSNSMTVTRLMEEKLVLEALRKARYDIEDPTHRLLLVNGEFKELFPSNDWNAPEFDLFQLSESSEDSEGETGNSSIAPYQIGFKSHLLSDPRYVVNPLKMPKVSFFQDEQDFSKSFAENDKSQRVIKQAPKRTTEGKGTFRENSQAPSKLRKVEFPIVLSARMKNGHIKRINVTKDEEFKTFDSIRREVKRVKTKVETNDSKVSKAFEEKWKEVTNSIIKVMKFFQPNEYEQNLKNLSLLCAKARKKTNPKTKKPTKEFPVRAKKLWRETQNFWKKRVKEMNDLKKKKEKLELEKKKKDEERLELQRQRKKIEFLIQRSSIYAEIMAKKLSNENNFAPTGTPLEVLDSDEQAQANSDVRSMINANQKRISEFKDTESQVDFSRVELEDGSSTIETPHSFKGHLKDYQIKGLRWLDNLYVQGINGILADEMGLGKTIQALSLLAHLSERYDNWGPFLVIAPATTLFNWRGECNKFCPALRVMPFWGSKKERNILRRSLQQKYLGTKDSEFHVVITSYQIAVSDEKILQRVNWQYNILDEAQAIKNMNGQRWSKLLELKSRNKLLLTGTPIQNTMAELWALLHFIMPKLFDSHEQFQEWFSKDIEAHSQNKQKLNKTQLDRLHAILKPFMLRRVKKDVEKEIGKKHEFEVFCELSSRQRIIYEGLKKKLSLTDFFYIKENRDKVENLMNLVMQLRKVCNHPDLFERTFVRSPLFFSSSTPDESHSLFVNSEKLNMIRVNQNSGLFSMIAPRKTNLQFVTYRKLELRPQMMYFAKLSGISEKFADLVLTKSDVKLLEMLCAAHYSLNCEKTLITQKGAKVFNLRFLASYETVPKSFFESPLKELFNKSFWNFYVPKVEAPRSRFIYSAANDNLMLQLYKKSPQKVFEIEYPQFTSLITDSAKLKYLNKLLEELAQKGQRGLIFCQMTKMLDILEEYLQFKKYRYLRLDGGSAISDRRDKVKEYQSNPEIFIFLLSTRAGGLGVTLTAADVVIFYDNDWNPTMDAQAADRAHRIGRTGDVFVYRLITKHTIEERIVKRAQQKNIVQQTVYSGEVFKGTVFKTNDVMSLLFDDKEIEEREKKEIQTKNEKKKKKKEDELKGEDRKLETIVEQQGEDETELDQIMVKKLWEEDN